MASPITPATGLGSGLEIGKIVSALVDADKLAKQTQITNQTKLVTTKLSGIGALQSAVAAFQDVLKTLGDKDKPAFNGYSAKSSNENSLTVISDNNAVPGSYKIHVNNIATSSSVATAAYAGGISSAVASGNLSITQNGITQSYSIPAGATLESVAKEINAQSKTTNVSANLITDDYGTRLVFNSTATGKGSDITTSSDIAGFTITANKALDTSSPSSAGYIGNQAESASFTINGMPITSASNKVDKTVSGMTINLVANNTDATVNVSTNSDGLKTSLQSFITAYNNVVKAITAVTKATVSDTPDPKTGATVTAAALTGDSMPRGILEAVRNVLITTGATGDLAVLSQLGITTSQTGGTLALDDSKFNAAMSKGLGSNVQRLFSGTDATNGLLTRMNSVLTPYTQTGGIFDDRKSKLTTQSNDLQKQQAALNLYIENLTATLTTKYNAMDSLVGKLKATASSITSFFDSLDAQKSG